MRATPPSRLAAAGTAVPDRAIGGGMRREPPGRALPPAMLAAAAAAYDMVVAASLAPLAGVGVRQGLTMAVVVLLCGVATRAYDPAVLLGRGRGVEAAITAWAGAALLAAMIVDRRAALASDTGLAAFCAALLLVTAGRLAGGGIARAAAARGYIGPRIALVGCAHHAAALLAAMHGGDDRAQAVVFVDDGDADGVARLVVMIRNARIDEVRITVPGIERARIARIADALAHTATPILVAPEQTALAPVCRDGLPFRALRPAPLPGGDRVVKAMFDRLAAAAMLIAVAPLLIVVAAAIRIESPGPILFRQRREGLNGRLFEILKFRTMASPAGGGTGAVVQTRRRDARVTRVGRFLRRSSIDELPQLLNVLRGEMSIVGPRPHAPGTMAGGRAFAAITARYPLRHRVKPGLTGWAQVRGWRGETSTETMLLRRLEHDLHYVDNWSLGFDLHILLRTVHAVLTARGAY